jgi:hypothetical protein
MYQLSKANYLFGTKEKLLLNYGVVVEEMKEFSTCMERRKTIEKFYII